MGWAVYSCGKKVESLNEGKDSVQFREGYASVAPGCFKAWSWTRGGTRLQWSRIIVQGTAPGAVHELRVTKNTGTVQELRVRERQEKVRHNRQNKSI